ncbi:hypothetical protein M3223_20460 [Paenibacillus pasadenensis]|uniref:hypothetical protein n=1 Tax=Paenibacillus pasadenensis TaxID=217090 RepID=UPI002040CE5A|nr:hypothetical protein [Paenibacillus pasadenensis]MCM3749729.1 hypothetical protein [Paenibacillus pasadenensis]
MNSIQRLRPRSLVERSAPVQRTALQADSVIRGRQLELQLHPFYEEARSRVQRSMEDTARWSEEVNRAWQAIRRMRERRRSLHLRFNPDLNGITNTVFELEEQWNSLGLLYFRCSASLASYVETELRRLHEHPAGSKAGFSGLPEGPWQVDRIRLRRLLEEQPDGVISALFDAEGLLPCAEEILAGYMQQPARALLSSSISLPYCPYNEDGMLEDRLAAQSWLIHESI